MVTRIILQIIVFLIPFVIFAIYRYSIRDLEKRGKAWPVQLLIIIGALLSFGWFIASALHGSGNREACYEPPRYVDGELRPGRMIEPDANGQCPASAQRRTIGQPTRGTTG